MSDLVKREVVDRVMVITVNRPEARNAINFETAMEMAKAFDELDADDNVVLGVLTGAGGTFSAGMDLKAFAKTGQRPLVPGRGLGGLCEKSPEKPLIAAVEGYALAGGCELALACDLIVASNDAKFGLPETKRGLVPSSGGMLRLPQRIPHHIAMEAVLTGEFISAERAYHFGMVNRLADSGQAVEGALALGKIIAGNGPMAVRAAKKIIMESKDWRQADMFDLQRPRVTPIFESADAKEGATAFAEKRKPVWQGK